MHVLVPFISGIVLGSAAMLFWYCEMFTDNYIGCFVRALNRTRGKNFTALTEPAFGASFISGTVGLFGPLINPDLFSPRHNHNTFWILWTLTWSILCTLLMLVALASFIPFTLPEWMYPEYHAAKREERRRREAAERGEAEERDPFLGDDGVYASQLGNVPIDIPEPVGLPPTTAPRSPQTAPAPGSLPAPHGSREAGAPTLHGPDAAPAPRAGTADAFDITAAIAALPRTGAPTSHGARPARVRRSPQEGDAAPTTDNATDEPDNTDETEHSSASSEAPSASPQAQSSEESLVRSSEISQGAGLMESQRELSTGVEDAVESAFAFYHYPKEGR